MYRAIVLEEIGKTLCRTARAKGLSEAVVLFRHVDEDALVRSHGAGSSLPVCVPGSLVFASSSHSRVGAS